ncbi:MAG: hypothetical protein H7338_08240 [Candidatus Sericytochromatia bacterium]|nr:hypothetical protein [Candidatus Sericytochromatia bacterium]
MNHANPDEWLEDRMFGLVQGERHARRVIPPDVKPEWAIAHWMLSMFRKTGGLSQKQALWGIRELFGIEHLSQTANGRWAIPRPVLKVFQELDPTGVVWSTHRRAWRPRQPEDPPGRRNVSD